jgi:hypothetical protein
MFVLDDSLHVNPGEEPQNPIVNARIQKATVAEKTIFFVTLLGCSLIILTMYLLLG